MSSTARITAISELRRAIARLRARELSFLDGVRLINEIGHRLTREAADPDFVLFIAIDSESDHLPNSHARSISSSTCIERANREESELESKYGAQVAAACERLLGRFDGHAA